MWTQSYSRTFKGVTPEQLWHIWTDINNWHTWNPGVESCRLDQPFAVGSTFSLKPIGSSPVRIQLVAVEQNRLFTDCTRFPGALMYGNHEMEVTHEGLKLTTTLTITGPLSFLWRKIVGEKIAAKSSEQTAALVAHARKYAK